MSSNIALEVKDLHVHYLTDTRAVRAVDGVSFKLKKGEVLGFAGESGCGKSTLALSLMKLTVPPGKIVSGQIILDGENILDKSEEYVRAIRWKKIAMIFQGAMNALNPVFRVGEQVAEAMLIHEKISKEEAYERTRELFEMVNLDPAVINAYPHQLSGGMKQRVVIAMAIALNPMILLADEPTTALDVTIQAQILDILKMLQKRYGMSMIYITHDLATIAYVTDTVAIMYAGKIVEYGDVVEIFKRPKHPYTKGLIASVPSIERLKDKRLFSMPGTPPDLSNPPKGCRFADRCPYAREICREVEPKLERVGETLVACHFKDELKDVPPEEFWAGVKY